MKIERHNFTKSKIADKETLAHYRNRIEKSFVRITEGKKINLFKLKDTPLNIAKTSIINSDHNAVYQNLLLTLEIGVGHIKRVAANDKVSVILNGNEYWFSNIDDNYGASFYDWFFLYSIAILCRSEIHLSELRRLDIKNLNPVSHPFWGVVYTYLIGLANENKEVIFNGIQQIRDVTEEGSSLFIDKNEKKIEITLNEGQELISTLWSPVLELYDCVYYNKPEQFNKTLANYLTRKKNYILVNKLEDDPRYWIDFPALGVCSYASDSGIEISIESDYIPSWLYSG